jgi:hypothetical protein
VTTIPEQILGKKADHSKPDPGNLNADFFLSLPCTADLLTGFGTAGIPNMKGHEMRYSYIKVTTGQGSGQWMSGTALEMKVLIK